MSKYLYSIYIRKACFSGNTTCIQIDAAAEIPGFGHVLLPSHVACSDRISLQPSQVNTNPRDDRVALTGIQRTFNLYLKVRSLQVVIC